MEEDPGITDILCGGWLRQLRTAEGLGLRLVNITLTAVSQPAKSTVHAVVVRCQDWIPIQPVTQTCQAAWRDN